MEINQQQQERIDLYLLGKLEGAELNAFLAALKEDAALAQELQLQEAMFEGIEFHGNQALRKRFQKISQEVKEKPKPVPSSKIKFIRIAMASAAAIAVLLICFSLFFQKSDPQNLFAEFYEPSSLSLTRSTDIDLETAKAKRLYYLKNYQEVIPLFQSILETQPDNIRIRLALGNAYVNTEASTLAIQEFQAILDQKSPLFSEQAKWYLALTHLKMEDLENTKTLLQELAQDEHADYHTEAVDLLKSL